MIISSLPSDPIPKFSDRQDSANLVDPDQTAPFLPRAV